MTRCFFCKYGDWVGQKNYFCNHPARFEYVEDVDWCLLYTSDSDSYDDEDEDDDDYGNSSCYITTATCNILGMDDNNYYLNALREFRNNVMKKDIKYHKLLVLYDIVGPKISLALRYDDDRDNVADTIMNSIKLACEDIKDNNYDAAIDKYYNMTVNLADYYGIDVVELSDEIMKDIVIEKAGTGKVFRKKVVH